MDKERASLRKTLHRQTQEWCDHIEELQDRVTRYATHKKSQQVKRPGQQGMDSSGLSFSTSLLKESASRVKENQSGSN